MLDKEFSNLKVLKQVKSKYRQITYECLCKCGQITLATKNQLLKSKKRSCGCLVSQLRSDKVAKGVTGFNILCSSYKCKANERKIEWSLTKEECKKLFEGNCYYCNEPPSLIIGTPHKNKSRLETQGRYIKHSVYTYSSIDRVDPDKEYTLDNCVSACKNCNIGKMAQSKEEFFNWITKVYKNITYNRPNITKINE